MRNRAHPIVALLGLMAFVLAPVPAVGAAQGTNRTEAALAPDAATRASAASAATIDVVPLGANLGIVNVHESATTTFLITNAGGADLNVSSVVSSNPDFHIVSSPTTVDANGGTGNLIVSFDPTSVPGHDELGVITINSDASNGPAFDLNVRGSGNVAPTLASIGDKQAPAFLPLTFTVPATDDDDEVGDVVTYSLTPGPPPGATFDVTTGAFTWTPTAPDAGDYPLTFCASDGRLDDCEAINIHVTANNYPPAASAGGPYVGGPDQPIQFDGSGSTDPDGDALTYEWDFGDDSPVGSGPKPTHSYVATRDYLASLTVKDSGIPSLSSAPSLASVRIVASLPATIAAKLTGSAMRVSGGSDQLMGMELVTLPVTDIDPATIRLGTTYPGAGSVSQIGTIGKSASVGDIDKDNVADLDVAFARSDLALLLGNVPNNTVVTLVMTARTTRAAGDLPIQGTTQVRIKAGGPGAVSAFASPNPFNPATSVQYSLKRGGAVTVRIYSLDGRLVKTLMEGTATAGSHELLWDGRDNDGKPVRSGMYFVKTSSGGESVVFKLALLK